LSVLFPKRDVEFCVRFLSLHLGLAFIC
jgi:hypothetical protein